MNRTVTDILLHLSLIPGIGAATIASIIANKPSTFLWTDVYCLSAQNWKELFGLSQNIAQKITVGLTESNLFEKEKELIKKHDIVCISREDDLYPAFLKEIYSPPPILYCKGNVRLLSDQKLIAIVGSRKANEYAKRVINQFAKEFVEQNWCVVSGGALGADGMAHEAMVRYGGSTIVVLGSGLLQPYPGLHIPLFKSVVAHNGLLVSIFPLSAVAHPGNFPARNRVIAGLSKGCIVVQAAEKSGARITAQFALQEGRDVFAIPGDIMDPLSAGCHALLAEGAQVAVSVEQILRSLGYNSVDKKSDGSLKATSFMIQESVSSVQKEILFFIKTPISIDDLALQTKLAIPELQSELFSLQLEGRVRQDFTGMWILN